MRAIRGACVTVLACCAIRAQISDASPAFEAASVKVSLPAPGKPIASRMNGGPGTNDPGRIDWVNFPLVLALMEAYDVRSYQISGPDWLNTARFDIAATIPKGATREQFRLMLRNLLTERFQLKMHHENRESTAYSLRVVKGGSKMTESPEDPASKEGAAPAVTPARRMQKDEDGFPLSPARPGISQSSDGARIRLRIRQETMAQFVMWLTDHLSHPVTDATELRAKYDFVLTYALPGLAAANVSEPDPTPDLIDALQQIGLKLEQKKGSIDTLVIDHMEKAPAEN